MRRYLFVSLGFAAIAIMLVVVSCKKINLATDLGQGIIPEVDNIHTFDTTIDIETYNHLFTALNDTLRIHSGFAQYLGLIHNDPIFGKTDARMYFQVGPVNRTRFYFPNTANKLFLDSIVLMVNYAGIYGDSTVPQTINVSEISQGSDFRYDSLYNIRNNDFTTTALLGSATIIPATLNDSVTHIHGRDTSKTVQNLRIKLDNSFGNRLLQYDSTNAYYSDSAFKKNFKGFALQSVSAGNAVMGFNLSGSGLKLYYRYEKKDSVGKFDTTSVVFPFSSGNDALANYVGRDYSGTQVLAVSQDNLADQLLYIQNSPGAYATLKIPALANMNNRIVHLAELQMESVYDPLDTIFKAPNLYIDALNADGKNFNVPFAVSDYLDNYGQVSPQGLVLFGSRPGNKQDASGKTIKYWRFNLTRYVQSIVNKRKPLHDLRLYAKPGVTINDTLESGSLKRAVSVGVSLNQLPISANSVLSSAVAGRVRLGGGLHPTQKMKMRIVYSKL